MHIYKPIVKDRNLDYFIEKILHAEGYLISKFDDPNDYQSFLNKNLHVHGIRMGYVEDLIKEENYDEAKEVTLEGMELEIKREHPRLIFDWTKKLLLIAQKISNQTDIVKWSKKLYLSGDSDADYYQILKDQHVDSDWLKIRNELIDKLSNNNQYSNHNKLIKLYADEGMYDELLNAMQGEYVDFYRLDDYCDLLIRHRRKETIQLYSDQIYVFLERNKSRKYYKVAVRYIHKIIQWGASAKAADIAQDLRIKYPRRSALIEELYGL